MRWSDLEHLREPRAYPAISIFAPLHRHLPGNSEDPIRLRDLADQVRRRVNAELGSRSGGEVLARLDDAIASVDLRHPAEGTAVFVAPGETHVLALPFPVRERVAVDETFATRDLVRGLSRSPRYRLLALDEKPARLLEGSGTVLTEREGDGFPCFVEGALGEPLASGGFAAHSSRSDEQRRAFFRRVDGALGALHAHDPLPVVIAGTERDLARFDEVTTHGAWIIGRLTGNHEDTRADELARLASPFVERFCTTQRAAIVDELVESIGPGRGIVGIKPAWEAATAGRVRVLLVEEDLVYPARIVDGHLEPAGDPEAPGVIDDAVDELIELVLDRAGDVVIVDSAALGDHGPAAALLRY